MKKIKRTRATRILAGGLAVLLSLGLVLLVDALGGDPWSRAFANRRMLAWANEQWPGNDFYIAEQFGGGYFTYDVKLQSQASRDTWFHVGSVLGLWGYNCDYESQVAQGANTLRRLEETLQRDAAAALQESAFGLAYEPRPVVSLETPQGEPPVGLVLDMPYDRALARQARLCLSIAVNGPPAAAEARELAAGAKAVMKTAGLEFSVYEVTLYDGGAEHQQREDTLVEAAFAAGELP